jgi:opacity protein-like surface antigen
MIGPWFGVNFATLSGADVTDASSHTGFAFGGQVQFRLGGAFLRTGVAYSMRGARQNLGLGAVFTIKENYIEIPVLIGIEPHVAGSIRPYVMAGGQLGIKASCKFEATSGGVTASLNCDDPQLGPPTPQLTATDFAAVAGAGVAIPVGRGRVTIDARYALGLQNIEKDTKAKNRGFTIGIGYMVPLGH